MGTSIDGNAAARAGILGRVRKALGKPVDNSAGLAAAQAYVAGHAHGPKPRLPADLLAAFVERAAQQESTIERIDSVAEVPAAVARYLDALEPTPAATGQKSHRGVCWPAFATLDWKRAGLDIEPRPTTGDDRLGITGCLCAIAETGTLVLIPGREMPTATALLPDTHVVVLFEVDVVGCMEEAFARVRAACPALPRAINLISGPSRTGDIEQTIVLGAHGPFRVHILLVKQYRAG